MDLHNEKLSHVCKINSIFEFIQIWNCKKESLKISSLYWPHARYSAPVSSNYKQCFWQSKALLHFPFIYTELLATLHKQPMLAEAAAPTYMPVSYLGIDSHTAVGQCKTNMKIVINFLNADVISANSIQVNCCPQTNLVTCCFSYNSLLALFLPGNPFL